MKNQLRPALSVPKGKEEIKVNRTIRKVKKGDPSNVEAEGGEQLIAPMAFDGFPAIFEISGPSHAAGGVDLNIPENAFIFSKDSSMKIENEDILDSFNVKDDSATPAEIARKYNINKFRKVLAEPTSDKMQRDTAEEMIKNYNEKLGKLALVQESSKSFSNGIPFVAIPYLEMMGMDASALVNGAAGNQNATVPTQSEEDVPVQRRGGELKIRIKNIPKFDGGREPKSKTQEFAYNEQFYNDFAKKLGLNDITAILPPSLADQRGMVDNMQHPVGSNTFGRKNWMDPSLYEDFKSRNAWYFEKNPKFDPKNSKDVTNFQTSYNERAKGMGLNPYFSSNTGSKYSVDGKFGEVTYSVPNLDQKAAQQTQAAAVEQKPAVNQTLPALQKPNIPAANVASTDNPFWTEDIINTAGAFGDMQRIKKYMPWQAGYETVLPDPTYYDPTRELAANAEQTNIADQALGAFVGPQALSARISSTQGQGLANAANILGKYNNMNVQVANQNELVRSEITNNSNFNRSGQATSLFDKTVATNQAFDNSKAMARQNFRQSLVTGWKNRGETQALNSMNKQFNVDAVTGFVNYTGKSGVLNPAQQDQNQVIDLFDQLRNRPGATDESATALLKVIMGIK